jgi:RNA polymerase sigma factor (sigma-70 family)
MEDRELVAAIAAGDPDGLAGAYDKYAESLYGYCRSMLAEPGDAAEAVQDTFADAVSQLSGPPGPRPGGSPGRPPSGSPGQQPGGAPGNLGEPGRVRSWLFATARRECLRRPRMAPTGIEVDAGEELGAAQTADASGTDGAAEVQRKAERAELQRLIRVSLAGLAPDEREAVQLSLWHDLDDAEVAVVLGVSQPRANALASGGRRQLEKALGTVRVARTGREACPELGTLLADWDGGLTGLALELAGQHIEHCEICDRRRSGTLRPAALRRLLPLPALPPELREQVLERCAAAEVIADQPPVAQGTESPPVTGFAPAVATLAGSARGFAGSARGFAGSAWGKVTVWLAGRGRVRRDPRVIAAVVVVLIAAAVSVPLIAVGGAHAVRKLVAQSDTGAAGGPGSAGTASGAAPASSGTGGSRSAQPGTPAPANYLQPSAALPGKVTPSKSPTLKPPGSPGVSSSASSSASASASASASSSSARPPSSRTPSSTPSSPSPSPTTASPTPSPSPAPTSS